MKLSIKGFVKIARIGTVMIPDRRKTVRTVSWWYLHDTGIVLAAILEALAIPTDTRFVRYCLISLEIGKYCLVMDCIVKVFSGITKYCQVSPSIVRYYQVLSQLTAKRNIIQFFCFIIFLFDFIKYHYCQVYAKYLLVVCRYCQVLPSIAKYCQVLPSIAKYCQVLPSIAKYCQVLLSISFVQYICRM